MPKKKTPPVPENIPDKVESSAKRTSRKPVKSKMEIPIVDKVDSPPVNNVDTGNQELSKPNGVPRSDWMIKNRWYLAGGICAAGLLLGFLLSYLFQVRPLQDLLSYAIDQRSTGEISSNQIKSDLSNTRLRQQEMEIRYLTATARLESANQYIILLRMKDQVSLAHLFVVEKDGFEARKALADIRTLFDQLKPYIVEKDAGAANELDDLIQTAVQDLTNDPESAASDLTDLETHLDKVEAALFQME